MRRKWIIIHGLIVLECFMIFTIAAEIQQKAESVTPIPTLSPPEGNTTFIDGTTWCVARPGVSQFELQSALNWACGLGGADCSTIQPGADCYKPDTLLSHASFAFNSYYQQNGNSDIACNFGGTAFITNRDPSYGACKYLTSEPASAASAIHRRRLALWITGILVVLRI